VGEREREESGGERKTKGRGREREREEWGEERKTKRMGRYRV
jgi:hypothetical protein